VKVGTVVVVNETGGLGIVRSIYPKKKPWFGALEVQRSKGGTEFFQRYEVTQLYKPRKVKKEVSTNVTKNPSTKSRVLYQLATGW
jgi:hypothetical protein